ncbi:MAG: DUF937 domain-containing protein [Methanolinea sp.]|jgi:hypothetical protein
MDSIVADLMKQVGTGDNLASIAKSVGGDEKGVQSALSMALPMVMGSMANSASTPGGADMITKMMGQMGGSSGMDGIASMLGGSGGSSAMSGMAGMLLGSQMGTIQNAIAKKTGLPPEIVGKVLTIATPMVMGYVGKMIGGKTDQKSLSSMLGEQSKMAMQASPDAAALANQFLGKKEEAAGVMGMLKKLFGS